MKFKITWYFEGTEESKSSGFVFATTEREAIEKWLKNYPAFSEAIIYKIERFL